VCAQLRLPIRAQECSVVTLAWKGVWADAEQHFFIGRDMTERIKSSSSSIKHGRWSRLAS
jgi:hypothetical protein